MVFNLKDAPKQYKYGETKIEKSYALFPVVITTGIKRRIVWLDYYYREYKLTSLHGSELREDQLKYLGDKILGNIFTDAGGGHLYWKLIAEYGPATDSNNNV